MVRLVDKFFMGTKVQKFSKTGNFVLDFLRKVFQKSNVNVELNMYLCKQNLSKNMQTYTYDEAFEASLAYFGGDELAARVWVNKYAMKDSFGNIYEKSPEQMHWRIANEIARIEKKYKNPMIQLP